MAGFTFAADVLKDSGNKYQFLKDGTVQNAAGKVLVGTELEAAHATFANEFATFKTALAEEEQIAHVRDVYDGLIDKAGKDIPALKTVHETFDQVGKIEQAVTGATGKIAADEETLVHAAIEQPDAFNLVSRDAHLKLTNTELADLAGIRSTAARANKMNDALEALYKTKSYDEKAVKAVMHQHGADLFPHLDTKLVPSFAETVEATKTAKGISPIHLEGMFAQVVGEAQAYTAQVGGLLDDIATAQKGATGRGSARFEKVVAEKVEALAKLRVENPHMDRIVHELYEAHPQKAVIEKAKGMSAIARDVGKAAEVVSKAGSELRFFSLKDQFTASENWIAKHTAAAGTDAAKLKTMSEWKPDSLRKMKIGMTLLGAAAVTYAAFAAFGSKGKHQQAEMDRQQAPQPGVGVA